ncbi:hypothetical protein BV20DRAFT_974687 [Pilatotrama ljubarskyi]|nr:hypothetical protein BV20DRAFT_974687 [Pilatotrama ljubarskyi]
MRLDRAPMGRSATSYKPEHGHLSAMLSSLSALVRRILHLPMAAKPTTLCTLLRQSSGSILTVDAVLLPNILESPYTLAPSEKDQLHPDHARICHLEFFKEREGLQHEYILAFVTVDGQPWDTGSHVRLGVIQCERNVNAEHDGNKNHLAAVSSSSLPRNPSLSTSTGRVCIPAADRFIVYDPSDIHALRKRGDAFLFLYRFEYTDPPPRYPLDWRGISARDFNPPEECPTRSREDTSPPSLYDLAAAAITLNVIAPEYRLFYNQCYWFASMLFYTLGGEPAAERGEAQRDLTEDTIRSILNPIRSALEADSEEAPAAPGKLPKVGTFRALFTLVAHKDVKKLYEDQVSAAFDRQLQNVYGILRDKVCHALLPYREAEEAKEEARQKDEELARQKKEAEEEARQKDEELARQKKEAEEAKKEAKEAKEQLAELKRRLALTPQV